MEEPSVAQAQAKELPRPAQVVAGVVLGLFTLLVTFASASMLVEANKKAPILTVVIGFLLLLGCFWVLEKCVRLVTGRKSRGGLLSPTALRVVAFFLLVFPVCGLFTGYYRKMGLIAVFQALMYVSGFFGLRALARQREATEVSNAQITQGPVMEVSSESEKCQGG